MLFLSLCFLCLLRVFSHHRRHHHHLSFAMVCLFLLYMGICLFHSGKKHAEEPYAHGLAFMEYLVRSGVYFLLPLSFRNS